MIQLNLLPDVKMQYIKAQRTKNMVLSTAIIISLASVGLLILLLLVGGVQKKHISDLNKDIKADTATLQKQPDIEKILTVQNQLQRLTELHESKPAVSNLFVYLNQVTPTQVDITEFTIDFTANTASVTGTADSLSSVNKYVDTLKFTTFTTEENSTPQKAFSDVVLSSFSLSTSGQIKRAASYTITMAYNPTIFDVTQKVSLSVPKLTTTRSALEKPVEELFQASPNTSAGGN